MTPVEPASGPPFFRIAAQEYRFRGWVSMPLVFDRDGYPKLPITPGWQRLQMDDIWNLPWERARGIGLVLGRASRNLAVIDLDDPGLAARVATLAHAWYFVQTARQRGHLYVEEPEPSASRVLKIRWEGRPITVELKAQGTQVAAPPSPGYRVVNDQPVITGRPVAAVWDDLAAHLGVTGTDSGNYPPPWQEAVVGGERNKSIYIEAHQLREGRGVPLHLALEFLRYRWERVYAQGGQTWEEVERTIRSAFRKGRGGF